MSPPESARAEQMAQRARSQRLVPSPHASLGDGASAARQPHQEQCQDAPLHFPNYGPLFTQPQYHATILSCKKESFFEIMGQTKRCARKTSSDGKVREIHAF